MEPKGVQRRYVPHLKGLISGKVELEAQGRDSTFIICYALLKKAILHYKRALASFVLSTTVNMSMLLKWGEGQGGRERMEQNRNGTHLNLEDSDGVIQHEHFDRH